MSKPASAALPIAYVTLRILIVVNWVYGAAVLGLDAHAVAEDLGDLGMHDDGLAIGAVLLDARSSASRAALDVAGLDRGDSGEVFEDDHA